jgi:hypothetical protein
MASPGCSRLGVPITDHHNHVFTRKEHRVTLIGDLIDFHASVERPRGHEILHHAAVPELVLDRVGKVRANLLKVLLKVVPMQSRLMLAATCDNHGMHHDGVACLLVDVAIIVACGCGLLAVLLVPLLAALGALLDILDDDIG